MLRVLLGVALLTTAGVVWSAPTCKKQEHAGRSFTVCTVDITTDPLRLFLMDDTGTPLGHFSRVNEALETDGKVLSFAMNAGMYHADRRPVGLYVEHGKQSQRLITSAGPGNFGLLPNGLLCLQDNRADVIETLTFDANPLPCRFATQSGPMLVIDGALHPRFLKDGTSRYVRNGVGTRDNGRTAIFAISDAPVTFYEFGTLFRDILNTPNALYFDGNISRLYAPSINRNDLGFSMGPIIGTTKAK
ncbi:MAG: phosphodiester glycosidase family protein [Pseudomonadota bacterium]